ncbi:hypothetical protein MMC25_006718 [Agyrium rufum]|nr:hypothetical protein [Agyrium rufum]
MATSLQQRIIDGNKKFASTFNKEWAILPAAPTKKYLILTCMDGRIDAFAAFGLEIDEAHIVRNGGGSVHDAMRSIVASEQMLGTKEVLVIKHTDCGFTHFKVSDDVMEKVKANLGDDGVQELKGMDFRPFQDPKQAAIEDVEFLKKSKAIPQDVTLSGWVYDVETGLIEKVV